MGTQLPPPAKAAQQPCSIWRMSIVDTVAHLTTAEHLLFNVSETEASITLATQQQFSQPSSIATTTTTTTTTIIL